MGYDDKTFHGKAAKPGAPLKSRNEADTEITSHPMGFTFHQKKKHHKKKPKKHHKKKSMAQWEGDGNGGSDKVPQPGVEKLDYWWHLDNDSKMGYDDKNFHDKAAKPGPPLKSHNDFDPEITSHPMGFSFPKK